jgi:putative methyltransferase (TIGR04325 family)
VKTLAPITLFVYNRPDHTKKTVEALRQNFLAKESDLFIFSDGPKGDADINSVQEVRQYLKTIDGFKSVNIEQKAENHGLSNSIIAGVTKIVNEFEKIIVLEDDLVTSKYFLQYMNDGLEFYKNEEKVISIHGYIFPIKERLDHNFFIKGADCWGWATWKRGWGLFNADGQDLLKQLKDKKLTREFDFDNSYPYTKMLEDQINGKVNSWAIRWCASAFLKNKLTLYPKHSLVQNIGLDGGGVHCSKTDKFDITLGQNRIFIDNIEIAENKKIKLFIQKFFQPKVSMFRKIKNKIKKKISKVNCKQLYGWFKTDLSWDRAQKLCSGYDAELILEKCKNSLLKVKNGEAEYERDSVVFEKIQYSWPMLSALLLASSCGDGKLDIIDFGGSLGSSYFQNRNFLGHLKKVNWNIVEQDNFVKCGQEYFQDDILKFYSDIDSCLKENNPNIILLSSVIQYLQNPYEMLHKIIDYGFDFIIIDRTTFNSKDEDILTIQKVPPEIYQASYPCWIFNKEKIIKVLAEKYCLMECFSDFCGSESSIRISGKNDTNYLNISGFIFNKKR